MILRPTYLRPPGELAHPHGAEVPAEPAPQRVSAGEGDLARLQPRVESRVLIQLGMVISIITIIIIITNLIHRIVLHLLHCVLKCENELRFGLQRPLKLPISYILNFKNASR